MNFQDFINKTKGKAIDVDGSYGAQCVDLFNYFNKLYNGGVYINCKPSGYARSLAENKNSNGILNYYQETAVNNMIEGTVVVYGNCSFAPQSHVCFFIKDNGNGTYQALQQNNGGKQYVTIDNNPYTGIIGAFIPKQLISNSNSTNTSTSETIYTIVEGDTLSEIAERYGTTYQILAEYNNIPNADKIYAGQKIRIPNSSQSSSAMYYTVKKGDSLWAIAEKYYGNGSQYPKIKELNGLTSDIIYSGQKLRVK